MKNALLFTISCCLAFAAFGQNSTFRTPQLSASTLQFLWKMENKVTNTYGVPSHYVYQKDNHNTLYVNTLIKVNNEISETELRQLGVITGTRAGNIWTARVPVTQIKPFTRLRGIQFIEMDQPMAQDLDSARKRTRVDSIHKGLQLPQAYSGKNVVVGIIDAGFDYTHPTFYDTAYQHYRVSRVWEEKNTSGTPPPGFGYGTEYTDSASILGQKYDITDGTHGTHVGGIAVGSGAGGPAGNFRKFRGVAYEADIVLVAIYPTAAYWLNTGMADMLDGINYTFQYGQAQGKPAVANLSWGCPLGPRNGNSLFSQACDNLTGPGKIFVLSGGNNGQNKIHTKKTFTPTDSLLRTFLTFPTSLPEKRNQVDVWGDSAQTFCMRFNLYNGLNIVASSGEICLTGSTQMIHLIGSNGDTCFITATGVAQDLGGKPHMLLQFYSRVADRLCLTAKATSGTIHMWQGIVVKTSGYYGTFARISNTSYPWATEGDVQYTTGDLVSTRSAIAVAAYNTKTSFQNVAGENLSYTGYVRGRIALFSSLGPTADERVKPDIAGPGMALASAISSFDTTYLPGGDDYGAIVSREISAQNNRTYAFGMAGGTSMASPMVSGIVALLLEANPGLDPQEIKDIFSQTSIRDNNTGIIPPNGSTTWGFGKVNAYGALKEVLNPTGIVHARHTEPMLIYPNPGTGNFLLEYQSIADQVVSISISDPKGKMVQTTTCNSKNGLNRHPLNIQNHAPGIYFIEIKTPGEIFRARVLKL